METTTSRKTWAAPYVVAALVLALLAAGVVMLGDRSGASSSSSFGMQRDTVLATPGARLSGRALVAGDLDSSTVRWTATSSGHTLASGTGTTWAFTAPQTGTVTLKLTAPESESSDSTSFRIVSTKDVLGRDASFTGRVLVDGGRAVQGEALAQGTKVDARGGSFAFTAKARSDTGLEGRVELEGTRMTLRSERVGASRVRNVVELDRAEGEAEQLLVAEVQHLDGTRYVQVETPDAVAMVKGTRFWVLLDEHGTDVAVDHGWVVVQRETGDATETIDVRDDLSTFVPRVPSDEATVDAPAKPAPLELRPIKDFDGVVDVQRVQDRQQLVDAGEPLDTAPKPPAGDGRRNPGPSGTSVADPGDGSGTARPPVCAPKCPLAPNGSSTPAPGTTPTATGQPPKPPACAADCTTTDAQPPASNTATIPDGTAKPPINPVPPPAGTTKPTCPTTGCQPAAGTTTQPPAGDNVVATNPTCPTTGCKPPPNTAGLAPNGAPHPAEPTRPAGTTSPKG